MEIDNIATDIAVMSSSYERRLAIKKLVEETRDDYTKGFAEWVMKNNYAPATTDLWKKHGEGFQSPEQWNATFKTTDELLTIYKNTLSKV